MLPGDEGICGQGRRKEIAKGHEEVFWVTDIDRKSVV